MTEDVEVTIGVVRPDYTEKAETAVLRGLAKFANTNRDAFRNPEQPSVAIILAHDLQFSPLNPAAVAAQQKAVRCTTTCTFLPTRLRKISWRTWDSRRWQFWASPHVLDESAWKQLTRLCLTRWDIADYRLVRPRSLLAPHLRA